MGIEQYKCYCRSSSFQTFRPYTLNFADSQTGQSLIALLNVIVHFSERQGKDRKYFRKFQTFFYFFTKVRATFVERAWENERFVDAFWRILIRLRDIGTLIEVWRGRLIRLKEFLERPLITRVDGHFISLVPRKPYHRVAPILLCGCSKDVPSFYQHNERDERKAEYI